MGDILLADYDSDAEATQSAAALNGFFESGIEPTMDQKCDSTSPFLGLALFLGAGVILVFGYSFTVYARVEALWDTHMLCIRDGGGLRTQYHV